MDGDIGVEHSIQNSVTRMEINESRESAFDNTMEIFGRTYDRNPLDFQNAIMRTFNEEFGKHLGMKDLSSLRYGEGVSLSASELAGREIKRPILVFDDPEQYRLFANKFGSDDIGSAMGFYLPFSGEAKTLSDPIGRAIKKSGIIVSKTENPNTLGHEVRHSIDPRTRRGFDDLLTETFAYAHDLMDYPEKMKEALMSYYEIFSEAEARVDRKNAVSGRPSMPRFGSLDKSQEWYRGLVEKVADKLTQTKDKIGAVNAQRELVNCATLEDYLNTGTNSKTENKSKK